MDPQYREIYRAIYDEQTRSPRQRFRIPLFDSVLTTYRLPDPARDALGAAIEQAQEPPGRWLREDAKALLAVNFQQLVVFPLTTSGVDRAEVQQSVKSDIRLLVRDAAEQSEVDGDGISGHAIIDALSRNWDRLEISRFRLWQRN